MVAPDNVFQVTFLALRIRRCGFWKVCVPFVWCNLWHEWICSVGWCRLSEINGSGSQRQKNCSQPWGLAETVEGGQGPPWAVVPQNEEEEEEEEVSDIRQIWEIRQIWGCHNGVDEKSTLPGFNVMSTERCSPTSLMMAVLSLTGSYSTGRGYAVAQLVQALRYKPEGRGFDFRWSPWNFSVT